jgi:hypothetical protein
MVGALEPPKVNKGQQEIRCRVTLCVTECVPFLPLPSLPLSSNRVLLTTSIKHSVTVARSLSFPPSLHKLCLCHSPLQMATHGPINGVRISRASTLPLIPVITISLFTRCIYPCRTRATCFLVVAYHVPILTRLPLVTPPKMSATSHRRSAQSHQSRRLRWKDGRDPGHLL